MCDTPIPEWVEHRIQGNINFLSFWAITLLTGVLGMISLLGILDLKDFQWDIFGWMSFGIYMMLSICVIFAILSCIRIINENIELNNEYFSEKAKEWDKKHKTLIRHMMCNRDKIPLEIGWIFGIVFLVLAPSYFINAVQKWPHLIQGSVSITVSLIGKIIQATSTIIPIYNILSMNKEKYIDEISKTIGQKIIKNKKEAFIVISLFLLGLLIEMFATLFFQQ